LWESLKETNTDLFSKFLTVSITILYISQEMYKKR